MNNFKENYKKEFEQELIQFLFLCGKYDGNILISKAKKNEIPEQVRLACIAVVFGYKKVFLKIIAQTQKFNDEFMKELDDVGSDFFKIDEWMNAFTDKIKMPEAQQLAREYWNEVKANVDVNSFHIRQFMN